MADIKPNEPVGKREPVNQPTKKDIPAVEPKKEEENKDKVIIVDLIKQ